MYLQSLHMENLRCFKDAKIEFQYPGREGSTAVLPNVNLLLGINGSGKTTVLKAICLATLSHIIERSGYVPYYLVRRSSESPDPESAEIRAGVVLDELDAAQPSDDPQQIEQAAIQVKRTYDYEELAASKEESSVWAELYRDKSPAFFVVGYGATRRVEAVDVFNASSQQKVRRVRYQRVAGVFEDHIALAPLSSWLGKAKKEHPKRFDEIVSLFAALLPEDARFEGQVEEGEAFFRQGGFNVPFSAMSDGYRSYIGWVGDLFYHLYTACPKDRKLRDMSGIVLVDEVDLHLHPERQREVVPMMSAALPNMQFVLTTHSPLVTGGLSAENIFLMEWLLEIILRLLQHVC